jgi:glycine oxidase
MLAPSLEPPPGSAANFAREARAIYPGFIARVEAESDSVIPHSFQGLLELTTMEELVRPEDSGQSLSLLSPSDLAAMEPHLRLSTDYWALLHRDGGWVDNVRLAAALEIWVSRSGAVRQFKSNVTGLERDGSAVRVVRDSGDPVRASIAVLAAGAWTPQIRGLPRQLPIEPVRGQMISVAGVTVNHVLIGRDAYAVPRPGEQALLGSTMEQAGFNPATTEDGISRIKSGVAKIAGRLATARETSRWAGLRPMTPDFLPIIGREPEWPALVYACGHSRNGILLAPLTGRCVAALVSGVEVGSDLTPFRPDRWLVAGG